jgi:hypothetical protein
MLSIRNANENDIAEIESMVTDFVKGHPAENHPRSWQALQWRLIHDMFWGMFGAETEWLYVKPKFRGNGVVAALIARVGAQASEEGARFLHGGGADGPSKLYERVAIGMECRECHLSGKAFQIFADLDGLPVREISRRLPSPELGLQAAER